MAAHQHDCTAAVLEETPDAAIVANLGSAAWTLAAVEDRPRNFYLAGAMGGTTPMGLGVAMATDATVTVLDGDGSTLMSLGELATVADVDPPNLAVVIWKNDVYETTGGQPLHDDVDLVGVAEDCGLPAARAADLDTFRERYAWAVDHDGAAVVVCDVDPYTPESRDIDYAHAYVKHRFREALTDAGASD